MVQLSLFPENNVGIKQEQKLELEVDEFIDKGTVSTNQGEFDFKKQYKCKVTCFDKKDFCVCKDIED